MALPRNIILTGFMGTGKTSVGRTLAKRLGWKFIDTDECIESQAGCSITHLFAHQGEAIFRQIESDVAERLAELERHVIATGGGMMLSEANRAALLRAGELIVLTAQAETIYERVRRATHRPLLAKPDPLGEIRRLLAERSAAYGTVERRVATDQRSVPEIVDEILRHFAAPAEQP
jgi:shikimate kinase